MSVNLIIKRATAQDIPGIKLLTNKFIGTNFYSDIDYENMISDSNSFLYVCKVEDETIAYLYFFKCSLNDACLKLNIPSDSLILKEFDNSIDVCVFKTTCMDINYRRKGYMAEFLDNVLSEIFYLDVPLYISLAMKIYVSDIPGGKYKTGDEPGAKLLINTGFKKYELIKTPWVNDTFFCPYCKQSNCICDGVIYIKPNLT